MPAARRSLRELRHSMERLWHVASSVFLDCPQKGLWVVADGMGGYRSGAIASQLIVANLAALPAGQSSNERLTAIRQCLHWLNRRLSQELTIVAEQHDDIMGSTVVVLLMDGNRGACIWAGDSRCYLWRARRLYQLSKDHSLLQRLIDEQQMSLAEARVHPAARALTRDRCGRAADSRCPGVRGSSGGRLSAVQ